LLHYLLLFIIQLLQFFLLNSLEVFDQARNRFEVGRRTRENLQDQNLWERVKPNKFLVKKEDFFIFEYIDVVSLLNVANGNIRQLMETRDFLDLEDVGSNEFLVLHYLIH
ncbi:hypothetical protein PENTCL1PPCAC_5953, partial [Pristionchus entomophagus]